MSVANPERTQLDELPKAPEDFTDDDLHLIKAMCLSANPWYPNRDMLPAWQSVYDKAEQMLNAR